MRLVSDHDHRLSELPNGLVSSWSTSSEAFESRFPVGSSANTKAGFDTSARATATRCC